MKFILYNTIIMIFALVQINICAMNKAPQPFAVTKAGQSAKTSVQVTTASPVVVQLGQPSAPTTIDVDVTLITMFDYPNEGSCSNFKKVQSKQSKKIAMNLDKTLEEHMDPFQKVFDSYHPLSFSKDGGAKIGLTTKIHELGTHIFVHKYRKLSRPPQPGEGE